MKIFDSLFEVNTTKDKNTEDDNTTEIARYDLKDRDGNASITEIFERLHAS